MPSCRCFPPRPPTRKESRHRHITTTFRRSPGRIRRAACRLEAQRISPARRSRPAAPRRPGQRSLKLASGTLYASPFSLRRETGGAGGSPATLASCTDTPSKLRLPVMCPGVLPEAFHHLLQPPFVKATALCRPYAGLGRQRKRQGAPASFPVSDVAKFRPLSCPWRPSIVQKGLSSAQPGLGNLFGSGR